MKPNTVLFLFPDGARIAFDRLPEPIKLADGLITSIGARSHAVRAPRKPPVCSKMRTIFTRDSTPTTPENA